MDAISTIGYEGADLNSFILTLKEAGVDAVLDVREFPLSRKAGFSKSSLRIALAEAGIGYHHEKSLGSPKIIRNRLKQDKNYLAFFQDFETHLDTQRPLLKELAQSLRGSVALLCYERDPAQCHRSSVARVLAEIVGGMPRHLGVNEQSLSKKKNLYSRQSLSTVQQAI